MGKHILEDNLRPPTTYSGEHSITNGVFIDESPFHLNANLSTQNQRVYTSEKKRDVRAESLQLETSQLNFEQKLQVFAAISVSFSLIFRYANFQWEETVCLHFFEPHETLGAECYIELLEEVILSACEEVYQGRNFVYQQDGAPAHRDKDT